MALNINLTKKSFAYTMGKIIGSTPVNGVIDTRTGELLPDMLAVAVRDNGHKGTSTLWLQCKLTKDETGKVIAAEAIDPELEKVDWSNGSEVTAAGRVQTKGGIRVIKAVNGMIPQDELPYEYQDWIGSPLHAKVENTNS